MRLVVGAGVGSQGLESRIRVGVRTQVLSPGLESEAGGSKAGVDWNRTSWMARLETREGYE